MAAFTQTFRRYASGVSVITALTAEGEPVGFTATSLASLAAVPPLATFNMSTTASAWPAIAATERVVIHTMGASTRHLAQLMSADHSLRFAGDHWVRGPYGLPIICGVTSWMIGRIVERVTVANSAMVVIEIEAGEAGEPDDALLYHQRGYHTPGESV